MRKQYLPLGLGALVLGTVGLTPAGANTLTLGIQEDGGLITTEVSGVPVLPGINFTGSFGTFSVNDISSADDGVPSGPQVALLTNDINIEASASTTAHTLNVFVTEQGIPGQLAIWDSHFTEQPLPTGWSVTQTTWLDPADGLFTGTMLASHTFPPSAVTSSFDQPTSLASGLGPFSVTEEFSVTVGATDTGSNQSTILLTGIPEPSTWAMMLLGFAGLGFAGLRGRRRAISIV